MLRRLFEVSIERSWMWVGSLLMGFRDGEGGVAKN